MVSKWKLDFRMKNVHRLLGIATIIAVTCMFSVYLTALGHSKAIVRLPEDIRKDFQRSYQGQGKIPTTTRVFRGQSEASLRSTIAQALNPRTTTPESRIERTEQIERLEQRNLSFLFDSKDEIRHVAFLKVHKAASSTVQNIFLRFGSERNLTFVLPPMKNPSGYPNIIDLHGPMTNSNILPPPPGKHYDILCNHVYYSYESFVDIMPVDTVFIGIVREPFELYKSILNYFRPVYIYKAIPGPHPVSTFLRNPQQYEAKGRLTNSLTNNRMAQEFGFPEHLFYSYDEAEVQKHIKRLDREFQLVLVAELLEESLLIMRRKLRWQTRDVLYISQNIATKKNTSILPEYAESDFYRHYARMDYDIYRHFFMKLRDEIRKQGPDFDDELLQFTLLRKKVSELCMKKANTDAILFVPGSPWGKAFHVSPAMCKDMKRAEMPFIAAIRERQYGANLAVTFKDQLQNGISSADME